MCAPHVRHAYLTRTVRTEMAWRVSELTGVKPRTSPGRRQFMSSPHVFIARAHACLVAFSCGRAQNAGQSSMILRWRRRCLLPRRSPHRCAGRSPKAVSTAIGPYQLSCDMQRTPVIPSAESDRPVPPVAGPVAGTGLSLGCGMREAVRAYAHTRVRARPHNPMHACTQARAYAHASALIDCRSAAAVRVFFWFTAMC
jgi:hypothetical protein